MSERRINIIANDQIGKINDSIENARALELGVTKAVWMHSSASKKPRPSHVKANGMEYDLKKGAYIDHEWIHPRDKIGCKCGKRLIIEL